MFCAACLLAPSCRSHVSAIMPRMENSALKALAVQFAKFGVVGVLAFFIEYGIFLALTYVLGVDYLVAAPVAYVISTAFNFAASMRYVFAGKKGQTRAQQFAIFFGLSLVGLGVNQLVLWLCVDLAGLAAWFGKLVATACVMVFNFVTRKIFLEDREQGTEACSRKQAGGAK